MDGVAKLIILRGNSGSGKTWYKKDLLDIIPEVLLYKELSLNEIVDIIY